MNKTWSIILIVVACIVVLGGTYWYFGMQKPKAQETPAASAVVDAEKSVPAPNKKSPMASSPVQAKSPLPEAPVAPKQNTAEPGKKTKEREDIQAKEPEGRQIPSPLAPTITKNGGFSLPTLEQEGAVEKAPQDKPTSVLVSETLPDREATPTPPEMQEEIERAGEMAELSPTTEGPVETETTAEPEKQTPVETIATPPANMILRSETVALGKDKIQKDKATLEGRLSVSFLDYNFPKDFTSAEKSFTVSVDIMSQKEMFGWGGTFEVGKTNSPDTVQVSLLARTSWVLGESRVTFPLSVSLGPTLFIDSTDKSTAFGMKAKLEAGVTYAISESFRIFYAVAVGATYNFRDTSSFRFVLEPIRVGVGFSF